MLEQLSKRALTCALIIALLLLFTSCNYTENGGNEAQTGMSGEASFLLEEYKKCVNNGDLYGLLDLFTDKAREVIENQNMDYSGTHTFGSVEISDIMQIDNDVSLKLNWMADGFADGCDAVETYLAEVDYQILSHNTNPERIGLPFTETKDRYLVFTAIKDGETWKIYSITLPDNLTQSVEAGVLPYEETREGRLSTLDLQLFEEEFAPISYTIPGVEDSETFSDVNGFFRSFYNKPEEIDLEEFMRYFGRQNWVNENDNKEEFEEIARLYKEKTGSDLAEQLVFAPPIKYNKADVDEVLMKYAGITSDDLIKKDYDQLLYSEKYQAYYNFTSDFGPGQFNPDEGYAEDGVYTFVERNVTGSGAEGYYDVRTVFIREGDRYKIVSREIVQ